MEARPANLGDVPAVGGLVQASLSSARSSMFGSNDLAEDPLEVGREILVAALAAGELAWVLETGEQIAGVAIATRPPWTA